MGKKFFSDTKLNKSPSAISTTSTIVGSIVRFGSFRKRFSTSTTASSNNKHSSQKTTHHVNNGGMANSYTIQNKRSLLDDANRSTSENMAQNIIDVNNGNILENINDTCHVAHNVNIDTNDLISKTIVKCEHNLIEYIPISLEIGCNSDLNGNEHFNLQPTDIVMSSNQKLPNQLVTSETEDESTRESIVTSDDTDTELADLFDSANTSISEDISDCATNESYPNITSNVNYLCLTNARQSLVAPNEVIPQPNDLKSISTNEQFDLNSCIETIYENCASLTTTNTGHNLQHEPSSSNIQSVTENRKVIRSSSFTHSKPLPKSNMFYVLQHLQNKYPDYNIVNSSKKVMKEKFFFSSFS